MSAAELHETIDGNGLIVNYKKYKAKKEEIEQLKKDIQAVEAANRLPAKMIDTLNFTKILI